MTYQIEVAMSDKMDRYEVEAVIKQLAHEILYIDFADLTVKFDYRNSNKATMFFICDNMRGKGWGPRMQFIKELDNKLFRLECQIAA